MELAAASPLQRRHAARKRFPRGLPIQAGGATRIAAANGWVLSGRPFGPADVGTKRCRNGAVGVGFAEGCRRGLNVALAAPPGVDWRLVAAKHGLAGSVPPWPLADFAAVLHQPGHEVRWLPK